MSLEQAIRQRWSADAPLTALAPLARCFTGAAYGDPPLPYVVLTRHGVQVAARTSGGAVVSHVRLRFTIWSADLELGRQIVAEIARLFDRAAFDAGDGSVLNMDLNKQEEQLQPDGAWQLVAECDVLVEQ